MTPTKARAELTRQITAALALAPEEPVTLPETDPAVIHWRNLCAPLPELTAIFSEKRDILNRTAWQDNNARRIAESVLKDAHSALTKTQDEALRAFAPAHHRRTFTVDKFTLAVVDAKDYLSRALTVVKRYGTACPYTKPPGRAGYVTLSPLPAIPKVPKARPQGAALFAVLQPFCGDSPSKEAVQTPWRNGGNVYATDGKIMARVTAPRAADEPENKIPRPNGEQVIPPASPLNFHLTLSALDMLEALRPVIAMDDRKDRADGTLYYGVDLYQSPDDCPRVSYADISDAYESRPPVPTDTCIAYFNAKYLIAIITAAMQLGETQLTMQWSDNYSPARFDATDATFVLMPMRKKEDTR